MDAQKTVEEALTRTLYRNIYHGHELYKILGTLAEIVEPSNEAAGDFIRSWILTLNHEEIYRKSTVQNNLIDLQHLIATYLPHATAQVVAPAI